MNLCGYEFLLPSFQYQVRVSRMYNIKIEAVILHMLPGQAGAKKSYAS
jgi:hypothetical protein